MNPELNPATILIVDDKLNILKVMKAILEREGYRILIEESGEEALKRASQEIPDLIISDIQMARKSGLELFHDLSARGMEIPIIFITAYATIPEAVSAVKEGAADYMTKPVNYEVLKKTIAQVLRRKRSGSQGVSSQERYLIGSSLVMQALYNRIDAVAGTSSSVLIYGENGTGKELVAWAIHRKSRKRDGPFIPVHCASFNPNLLESELFGYEAGAFTGAVKRKIGFLETASDGTLFLDEISELVPDLQVKLLRVLQEKAFHRVGGTSLIHSDFRLLSAGNKDLEKLVSQGGFRQDLFYRLNVIPINVPPLRERREDIPELVAFFSKRICEREGLALPGISGDFLRSLSEYSWPGNVRELENLVERILVLYRPEVFLEDHFLREVPSAGGEIQSFPGNEKKRIQEALVVTRGNKTEAARLLGMPRRTLYYKIKRYGIDFSNI